MPGKKLLVADDSLTIQKVIRLALSNEGYDIQAISDGADAIQQIATFRPDAVLIDVSLPSQTAFDIKREVNGMDDHRHVKFILMSSAFEKIDEAQAAEVRFDGRLTKPFDPAHLRAILSEVLSAAVPPSPPKGFPRMPAEKNPPQMPPLPFSEPSDTSSSGITLEPPRDLPGSDFDVASPIGNDEDELWGRHEEEAAPPPLPSSDMPELADRDDIRQLTESTIRMTGLAELPAENTDFEWKVNEPSLKPPSSMSDLGGSSFQIGTGTPAFEAPLETAEAPQETHPDPVEDPVRAASLSLELSSAGISDSRIEEMVRRQIREALEGTLEKMAREILPELAERVIKTEINKLLNEKI